MERDFCHIGAEKSTRPSRAGHANSLSGPGSPGHDLRKDGFYAATREAEPKCPNMQLTVLWAVQDVTEKVNAAAPAGATPAEANTARRKAILAIEKESQDRTGLDSRVVTLYHG